MKNNNENKNLILKNSISFIISLCPIYSFILFMVYLRINGIYLKGGIGDYFGLIAILPFIYLVLLMSIVIAIPALCFTIKYIIDMIKSKNKIFIAIIEIIIYILIIIFLIIIFNQST
ncbi:MAG: hypothetical protein IJK18_07000 [Clostridia bacterium]|nr:hypothetical protein [Clostridia bacterium]